MVLGFFVCIPHVALLKPKHSDLSVWKHQLLCHQIVPKGLKPWLAKAKAYKKNQGPSLSANSFECSQNDSLVVV